MVLSFALWLAGVENHLSSRSSAGLSMDYLNKVNNNNIGLVFHLNYFIFPYLRNGREKLK